MFEIFKVYECFRKVFISYERDRFIVLGWGWRKEGEKENVKCFFKIKEELFFFCY